MKVTEVQVASAAERYMASNGWTVYREVRGATTDARADLVGQRSGVTWVVECKTRLSLDLIDQAVAWVGCANLISVCVPRQKAGKSRPSAVLRHYGIGVLEPHRAADIHAVVREPVHPRFMRTRKAFDIAQHLHEDHLTMGIAGSSAGGYATPWKRTMARVVEYVRENGPCSIKAAVEFVDHHYKTDASARAGIATAIREGWLDGVALDKSARPWRLVAQ